MAIDINELRQRVRSGNHGAAAPRVSPPPPRPSPSTASNNASSRDAGNGWIVPIVILGLIVAAITLTMNGNEDGASSNQVDGALVTVAVTSTANARDKPTTQNSVVFGTYPQGTRLQGRWVRGKEPSIRWLEVELESSRIAYVWEGNLQPSAGTGVGIPQSETDYTEQQRAEELRVQQIERERQERLNRSVTPSAEIVRMTEPYEGYGERYRMVILVTDVSLVFEGGIYRGEEVSFSRVTNLELNEFRTYNTTSYSIVIKGKARSGFGEFRREFECKDRSDICSEYYRQMQDALEAWRGNYADLYRT